MYNNILFPKLHDHQQVLLVPGTFACSNLTYFALDDQAKNVVDKMEGYFKWAKAEKRIAGFNPWSAGPPVPRLRVAGCLTPWCGVQALQQSHGLATARPAVRHGARGGRDAERDEDAQEDRHLHPLRPGDARLSGGQPRFVFVFLRVW